MCVLFSRFGILALRRRVLKSCEDSSREALLPFALALLGLAALLEGSSFPIFLTADESEVERPEISGPGSLRVRPLFLCRLEAGSSGLVLSLPLSPP